MGNEHAVPNPLAREIVDAVQMLGLKTVFEPGKMHPRDWSNPGRVRVLVKEEGRARSGRVKNSMFLSPRLLLCIKHGGNNGVKIQKVISTSSSPPI